MREGFLQNSGIFKIVRFLSRLHEENNGALTPSIHSLSTTSIRIIRACVDHCGGMADSLAVHTDFLLTMAICKLSLTCNQHLIFVKTLSPLMQDFVMKQPDFCFPYCFRRVLFALTGPGLNMIFKRIWLLTLLTSKSPTFRPKKHAQSYHFYRNRGSTSFQPLVPFGKSIQFSDNKFPHNLLILWEFWTRLSNRRISYHCFHACHLTK